MGGYRESHRSDPNNVSYGNNGVQHVRRIGQLEEIGASVFCCCPLSRRTHQTHRPATDFIVDDLRTTLSGHKQHRLYEIGRTVVFEEVMHFLQEQKGDL